jgi:hypothetical protein
MISAINSIWSTPSLRRGNTIWMLDEHYYRHKTVIGQEMRKKDEKVMDVKHW